jgi:hypothetical protein
MYSTPYSCQILINLEFSRLFNTQISNSMKIRPVGVELFHAKRQTDGQDEATVAFRNFANAPTNYIHCCRMRLPNCTCTTWNNKIGSVNGISFRLPMPTVTWSVTHDRLGVHDLCVAHKKKKSFCINIPVFIKERHAMLAFSLPNFIFNL